MVRQQPFFTLESGRFALNANSGLAEPVSSLLPANNPYNPYGRAIPIEYTFFDLGGTIKTNRSTAYRGVFACVAPLRTGTGKWLHSAHAAASVRACPAASPIAGRWPMRWPPAATTC